MQKTYAETYINSINYYLEPVQRKLIATVYEDETLPLLGIQFTSRDLDEEVPTVQVSPPTETMRRTLPNLYKLSFEQFSRETYHRRTFRIYDDQKTFSVFKPAERRLWTLSAALSDAEETLTALLRPKKVLR